MTNCLYFVDGIREALAKPKSRFFKWFGGIYKHFLLLWLGIGAISTSFSADSWTDISPSSGFGSALYAADCSYDEAHNLLYVLWPNQSGHDFNAARYDCTSHTWTQISPSPAFGTETTMINSCYDSFNQRIYAAWSDIVAHTPGAAYYDGTNWTNLSSETSGYNSLSYNVGCCSNGDGRIYFTWAKYTHEFQAAYYDGSFHDISDPSLPQGVQSVDCCYNSTNRRIYAVWPGLTRNLKAAYYDITTGWTDISPLSGFVNVGPIAKCCYDSDRDRVYVTWNDQTYREDRVAYYDGTWHSVSPGPGNTGLCFFADCCFSSANHRIYETLTDFTLLSQLNVSAAYYDGATWTSIPPGFGRGYWGISCCYDSTNNRVYISYAAATGEIYAAVYGSSTFTFTMTGIQLKNDFAIVSEQYNSLFWQNPSTSTASYRLERNGILIATLPGGAASYDDHNRIASVADTYLLSALDVSGNVIGVANITIQGDQR